MSRYFFPVYMSMYHVQTVPAHRVQKRSLDPLEPELQTVVNYPVGAGNRILVLWK